MKVSVDPDRCQGHERCAVEAEGFFTFAETGENISVALEVPIEREREVLRAIQSCPEIAISIDAEGN